MTAYVFAGPTLNRAEVEAAGDVVCLPPAARGDVYRVALMRPRALGIIDGYFDGVPSVLHKEVLFAMAEGIHVFGAASMGALRAAELHAFGMQGVGAIFEAYCDGRFEDDDEVAVAHGPAETGYAGVSEAMANIRATLARAASKGVIGAATRDNLEAIAKAAFFQERRWPDLLDQASARGLPDAELEALRAWLPGGRIDQKRADALALLEGLRAFLASDPGPKRVDYNFEWTEPWDSAFALGARFVDSSGGAGDGLLDENVLDELRLEGGAYRRAIERALFRLLGLRECERRGLKTDPAATRRQLSRFRAEQGLFARQDLDRWLAANQLNAASLERLLADKVRLDRLGSFAGRALEPQIMAHLQSIGDYMRLAARARDKERELAARGLGMARHEDAGPGRPELLAWYFERRLGRAIPDNIDAWADEHGFADRADFYRALRRERLYCKACEQVRGRGELD